MPTIGAGTFANIVKSISIDDQVRQERVGIRHAQLDSFARRVPENIAEEVHAVHLLPAGLITAQIDVMLIAAIARASRVKLAVDERQVRILAVRRELGARSWHRPTSAVENDIVLIG